MSSSASEFFETPERETFAVMLSGPHFGKDSTIFHELLVLYDALDNILNTSYLNLVGNSRFTEFEKENFKIIIQETKDNSWDTFFGIVVSASPLLFGNSLTGTDILSTVKATWDFLKCVYTLKTEGVSYTITNRSDGNLTVNTGTGEQFVFNGPVTINLQRNASETRDDFEVITEQIKRGTLSNFKIDAPTMPEELSIEKKDANVFDVAKRVNDQEYELDVEIYRYNKKSRTGKLQVETMQGIPEGKYAFVVNKSEIQDSVIMSMLQKSITIKVKLVLQDDPVTNSEEISYLELSEL